MICFFVLFHIVDNLYNCNDLTILQVSKMNYRTFGIACFNSRNCIQWRGMK